MKFDIKIKEITKRNILFIYEDIFKDMYLNIHLIKGDKYNYIIDTGLGSKTIESILEYLGNDKKEIIVINTHFHWDHIWGNSFLEDKKIISHKICRDYIDKNFDKMLGEFKKLVHGETKKFLPNLVFEDSIYFSDDQIKIFYTPGHSIDCISVLDEKDKVLNVGDNIGDDSENIVPYIEDNSNLEIYKKTLEIYNSLDFDTCISGHREVLDKNIIREIIKKINSI